MKSCKVMQQKTHYYINLVYNDVHAHYKHTRKAHCRELETGQAEVLMKNKHFEKS